MNQARQGGKTTKIGDPQIIDWNRGAEMWQGNIIQGNKLLTQQVPVRRAYEQVTQAIGLGSVCIPAQQTTNAVDAKEAVNG